MKKRGLGRGLNELLGESPAVTSSPVKSSLRLERYFRRTLPAKEVHG